MRRAGGPVGAAWDGDGAEPVAVGACAVVAGAGERVLGGFGGVAGDLLEGVGEILEEGGSCGVVEILEAGEVVEVLRGGGDGVGEVWTGCNVEEELAVAV